MFSTTGSSGWKKVLALIYPEDKEEKLKSSFVKCAVAKYRRYQRKKMAALYEPEKVALKKPTITNPKESPRMGRFLFENARHNTRENQVCTSHTA